MDTEEDGSPCCKVGRSATTYGLDGLDRNLERRRADGESLRDLADYVNRSVFAAALAETETTPDATVVGDADALYDVLTDEAASAGRKAEIRTQLDAVGLDVDRVEDDFVSHQTVKHHLQSCLDVDTSRESTLDTDEARSTIEWARTRNEAVIERTLDQLRRADELDTGDLEVTHAVRVTCQECNRSYHLRELLAAGGCECAAEAGVSATGGR